MDPLVIIFKLLPYAFYCFLAFLAFIIANDFLKGNSAKVVLISGLIAACLLSFFLSDGTPPCRQREYDTQGSVCIEYAEDGDELTVEERTDKFVRYLAVFGFPIVLAVILHIKNKKRDE